MHTVDLYLRYYKKFIYESNSNLGKYNLNIHKYTLNNRKKSDNDY